MSSFQTISNVRLIDTWSKRVCVIVIAFLVLSAYFFVTGYRSNSHFAYVMVRAQEYPTNSPSDFSVFAESPWGTKTEMQLQKNDIWEIPSFQKRPISRIVVEAKQSHVVVAVNWELSVSRTPSPVWHPAQVSRISKGLVLLPNQTLINRSFLPSRRSLINWQGDFLFLVMIAAQSIACLLLAAVAIHMIFRAPLIWRTRFLGQQLPNDTAGNSISFPTQFERAALWAAIMFCLGFALCGGGRMTNTLWPSLHDDAVYFTTIIINRAANLGNQFAVYTPVLLQSGGETDVTSHGQLYAKAIAWLLNSAEYHSLLYRLHQINLITFVLSWIAFAISMRRALETSWLGGCLVATPAAFTTFAILHYLQGRPEHGIPLVLVVFALLRESVKRDFLPPWLQGIQIGVVAAISPLPGAAFGIASAFSLSLRVQSSLSLVVSVLFMLVSTCTSWVVLTRLCYDGALFSLVANTASAGKSLYTAVEFEAILEYWWRLPLAPGLGLFFAFISFIAVYLLFKKLISRENWVVKVSTILCLSPLVYMVWRNAIAFAGVHYCFIGFFPVLFLWVPAALTSQRVLGSAGFGKGSLWPSTVSVVAVLLLVYPSWGFVRTSLMQSSIRNCGVPYLTAFARVRDIKKNLGAKDVVLIESFNNSRSAIVFDGLPWGFRSRPNGTIEKAEKTLDFYARYFLVLQYSSSPPVIPGFELFEDRFVKRPAMVGGRVISWYMPGYGYAIYERKQPAVFPES